jgi:hypothetical protein
LQSRDFQEHLALKAYVSAKYRRWHKSWNFGRGGYGPWRWLTRNKPNLKTNAGVTFFAVECYGTSGTGTAAANYMAVTATAITPAVTDTTLSGELDNTNGFGRAQATVTNGTAASGSITTTISKTYTATGTQNNIQGGAVFTAASGPTLCHEYTFTLNNYGVNDQLTTQLVVTTS